MPKFYYRARNWGGKLISGVLDMADKTQVINSVKESGLVPIYVIQKKEGVFDELSKKVMGRASSKQVANITRELSTMMTAGLALTDALSLLRSQVKEGTVMFEILDHCLKTVQGGQSLGTALNKYKGVFGEAYVASINAGEEGGVLEEILAKLADNLEEQEEFKGKIKGAMIYPIIVIVGMIAVAIIMMVVVIPKLMTMYNDFGSKMPPATVILMAISNIMAKTWFLFPLFIFGFIVMMRAGNKNKKFRTTRDKIMLKIPILGPLTNKTIVTNTCRTLSMLTAAGISVNESLNIVASVAGNEIYYDAFMKISQRVQKGFDIASSFEETGIFPSIVIQMVATGEATGKLDDVLMRVSNFFKVEAEQSVKALTAAIEPLIMIVLGIGVAFLIIAVLMPIYNLTSQF